MYLVTLAGVPYITPDEHKAVDLFRSHVMHDWKHCIKFSCINGRSYDDNHQSLSMCNRALRATINGKEYSVVYIPNERMI